MKIGRRSLIIIIIMVAAAAAAAAAVFLLHERAFRTDAAVKHEKIAAAEKEKDGEPAAAFLVTPEPATADGQTPETPSDEPGSQEDPSREQTPGTDDPGIPEENGVIGDLEHVASGTAIDESRLSDDIDMYFRSYVISDTVRNRIYGDNRSYKTYSTISMDELRYIKVLYCDFSGQTRVGELIVNVAIASDITEIFKQLWLNGYQINKMVLVDEYDADDDRSIADNNTSAFNYRTVFNTGTLSNHALGMAIDINPYNNPYFDYDANGNLHWYDDGADQFIDRNAPDAAARHMINHNDLCYQLFTSYGFTWGGDWGNPLDYQHFERAW